MRGSDTHFVLPPGTAVSGGGGYRILRLVGAGSYGFVYEAVSAVGHHVALKECFLSGCCGRVGKIVVCRRADRKRFDGALADFRRSAAVLASLQGIAGVVGMHETFEACGTAYCTMDLLDGPTLTALVQRDGPLPEQRAADIIRQIAATVTQMHRRGVCHLDIQPDNVMLHHGAPVLVDFGQACRFSSAGNDRIRLQGCSDGYAAPEQYEEIRRFSPAADIYAVGGTALFLLSGRTPERTFSRRQLPASLSTPAADAVATAMHADPKKRRMPFYSVDFGEEELAMTEEKLTLPNATPLQRLVKMIKKLLKR